MKLIERTKYLDQLKTVIGTPDIKVITGVRRSGKSKLLETFIEYIKEKDPQANVIHINFNLLEYAELTDYMTMHSFVTSKYKEGCMNLVFIDEVQMCKNFEKAINDLHTQEKYDIYITGSNAFLLSSDLATLFTGRTFEIEVFPFSYAEYVSYYGNDEPSTFEKYIREGGMAGSYLYENQNQKLKYLQEVFDTLVIRDIQQKYKIRNKVLMGKIVDFMMDNVSNIFSLRSITNALSANDDRINHKTIGLYLEYLCNAFAFYRVRRYDIQGRKYLASNDKYYLCDHSFRFARLGTKNMNYGRMIENIVAIELLRRGYEIYVGVLYKREIDFVAVKQSEKIYIQVADNITEEKTFNREVSPLLAIKDAYPKMIIANTKHPDYDYEGVRIIDVSNWLSCC